jgi:hypothetical protein
LTASVIDDLARGVDRPAKVRVADGALREQVDLAVEEGFERFGEVEVAIGVGTR